MPYVATTDKGTQIMQGLLLSQYQNSPNLTAYLSCFIEEIDYLFEQIEAVYYGRFLEEAVGAQLDVIGIILQQPRSVVLPTIQFGFDGAPAAEGFSTESNPSDGGIFLSETLAGFETTPLGDEQYRNLLLARAFLMNKDSADINTVYEVVSILMGKIPRVFKIEEVGFRAMQLSLGIEDTTLATVSFIIYATTFFVPAGITLTISRV